MSAMPIKTDYSKVISANRDDLKMPPELPVSETENEEAVSPEKADPLIKPAEDVPAELRMPDKGTFNCNPTIRGMTRAKDE